VGDYNWKGLNNKSRTIEVKPPVGISRYSVADPYNCLQDEFEVHVSNK
jgi:hypothetical protein